MNKDQFREFEGRKDGPTSIVLAGVHGNELPGLQAMTRILDQLQSGSLAIQAGRVWFGYGNPRAIEQGVRATDQNLNRMFLDPSTYSAEERASYEFDRAQVVMGYLDQADALHDTHGTRNPRTRAHVIGEPHSFPVIERLPVNLVLTGVDAVEPGGTDHYMNTKGKKGICLEPGYNEDPNATKIAVASIRSFLMTKGHIPGEPLIQQQRKILVYGLHKTETDDYELGEGEGFADFDLIKEGQSFARDGAKIIRADRDSYIIYCSQVRINKPGVEAYLLGQELPARS